MSPVPGAACTVRWLGQVDYEPTWQAMMDFTATRTPQTQDELWVCEHPPVFTLGQAGKISHLLADHGVAARRLDGAPGVYIDQKDGSGVAKIAALGLRVRKNGCYHGLSLNVDMDLSPFAAINPCGYAGMAVTQTRDLGVELTPAQAAEALVRHLARQLEQLETRHERVELQEQA